MSSLPVVDPLAHLYPRPILTLPLPHILRSVPCACSHTIDLTLHPDLDKHVSRAKLVRYQTNPTVNWGPAGKARNKKEDAVEGEKALVHGNAGGRKRKQKEISGNEGASASAAAAIAVVEAEEEIALSVPATDEDDEEAMMNA